MAATRTENETQSIVELLGGRRVFSRRIQTKRDLQDTLRKGFPYAAFEAVQSALEFPSGNLAQILGVASRTLARRKMSRQLSPIESDRLYRVAHVTLLTINTLGSLEKARAWLHRENQALGGESPVSLLDTEIGERQVEDVLNRINYGIFS